MWNLTITYSFVLFIQRYNELNLKSSEMYRKYDSRVPNFLHNRPKDLVHHILKRSQPAYPDSLIRSSGNKLFIVRSELGDDEYQVWLGSDTSLPSCQCFNYKVNKLPCKHLCAVVNLPEVGWESLGASFKNYPLYKLDNVIVPGCPESAQEENPQSVENLLKRSSNNELNNKETTEDKKLVSKKDKQLSERKKCVLAYILD